MSIARKISPLDKNKIIQLVKSSNPEDLLSYLKEQLEAGKITPIDIYNCAKTFQFTDKPGKPYIISADIINRIGLIFIKVEDVEQAKFVGQFLKLAAERNSIYGNRNYAFYLISGNKKLGIQKSPELALDYAKRAVDLSSKTNYEHEHKLILCRAQNAHQGWKETDIHLLMDYIAFKLKQFADCKDAESKQKREAEIESALELLSQVMNDFQKFFEDENDISKDFLEIKRAQLESILTHKTTSNPNFERIRQEAYYLQGKCYESLHDYPKAMITYCKVNDKQSRFYTKAIDARARLLKEQVKRDLSSEHSKSSRNPVKLTLPDGMCFPVKFGKSWLHEADWLDSVDEKNIEEEYEKRKTQLEPFITAKHTEIELIDEILEDPTIDELDLERERIIKKKASLEQEIKKLQQTQSDLLKIYKLHLHAKRQIYRRHITENHFFNPRRSKKQEELLALTCELIDQRFRHEKSPPSQPINLTNKSSRLLITAEKAFQNAVIALTGKDDPILGIPTLRTKPWSLTRYGDHYSGAIGYGPTETYQIGDTSVTSEHRTSPKRNRLGDSLLPNCGTYNREIYPLLSKFTDDKIEKEKQLATLMIQYGRTHHPIAMDELQKLYPDASNDDVDNFNKVCFLIMGKEQSQWLSAINESFQVGMSVAQARFLIMMEAGFIRLKEVLQNNALFSVYSRTELYRSLPEVTAACEYIDKLYMFYLQEKHQEEYFTFFKRNVTNKSVRLSLTTRKQAHEDMKYVYGGSSDTDDEGYDTDLSM